MVVAEGHTVWRKNSFVRKSCPILHCRDYYNVRRHSTPNDDRAFIEAD